MSMSDRVDRQLCSNQSGLSLLEILVAFAIMGFALVLVYRVAGGAAQNTADIALRHQAVSIAQSLLSSRNAVLQEGWNEEGQSGNFTWRAETFPWTPTVISTQTIPLQQLRLTISWSQGTRPGHITVDTLLPQRNPQSHEVVR